MGPFPPAPAPPLPQSSHHFTTSRRSSLLQTPESSKGGNGMIPRGMNLVYLTKRTLPTTHTPASPARHAVHHSWQRHDSWPLKPEGTLALMVSSPPSWQLEFALSDFDGQTEPYPPHLRYSPTTGVSRRLTVTNYHLSRHPSHGDLGTQGRLEPSLDWDVLTFVILAVSAIGMDGGRDRTQHSMGKWLPAPLPERSLSRCRLADCRAGNTNPMDLSKPSKHQRQPKELQPWPGTCCFEPIDSGRVPFARVACERSQLLVRRYLL
ncbi:hypothetical protein CSIM01_04464 [Colletotrichum simmondsii]|uniref:Uncharacterized protein n=1 Tax=Colletotrichum simmondsii TaxID=703756 RepID=A0A135T7N9_9PEZI|nr:hypothetical protein CSIM01_04464 [Colletotrichum simmondsii]